MSTQIDKISNIVMQNAQYVRKERDEDPKKRAEERKFQQQQMEKQMEATRKAREADREFFRNLMQMRIVDGIQQQNIDKLPPTPQLIHQSQQQTNLATHSAATTKQIPPASLDYTMHDNGETEENKDEPRPSKGDGWPSF